MTKLEMIEKLFTYAHGDQRGFGISCCTDPQIKYPDRRWEFRGQEPNGEPKVFAPSLAELLDRVIVEIAKAAEQNAIEIRGRIMDYDRLRAELPCLEVAGLVAVLTSRPPDPSPQKST